jgi:hypothetical protein
MKAFVIVGEIYKEAIPFADRFTSPGFMLLLKGIHSFPVLDDKD